MSERRFIENTQDQDFLLPPSLLDWLPEGHLSYFVLDSVDSSDLCEWDASYASKTGAVLCASSPFQQAA